MIRFILLFLFLLIPTVKAGVNILIVGSTEGYDKREQPKGHGDHLDLNKFAPILEKLLNRGTTVKDGTSVVFEDVHRTKMVTVAQGSSGTKIETEFHCHSLAQYYFWPDGRDDRLANLGSRGGTKWDYVIIIGDPYIISEMPGVYAEGVSLLANKIKEGGAKVVLLMPWHSDKSKAERISEAVNRVGQGLEIPVAPAGETWAMAGAATDGEYMAAASVFSALSKTVAWSSSPSESLLAKRSLATVKKNMARAAYSELVDLPNPFAMKYVAKEVITFNQSGSSSEGGIKVALIDAMKRLKITPKEVNGDTPADFNYGRGNSNFEPDKRYKVKPDQFGRSYGFPMQEQTASAAESMLYGIDKRYFKGANYDDGTDLGIAYDMIREGEVKHDVRAVPIRLLWAKLKDANPKLTPLRDKWHMSRFLDAASGTYMVTLLTGKNPVGDEPPNKESDEWNLWLGRKTGYETAMRMAHLKYDQAGKYPAPPQ